MMLGSLPGDHFTQVAPVLLSAHATKAGGGVDDLLNGDEVLLDLD